MKDNKERDERTKNLLLKHFLVVGLRVGEFLG
jgi:hypothetical protein